MNDERYDPQLSRIERKIDRLYGEFSTVVAAGLGVFAAYEIERTHLPLKDWIAVIAWVAVTAIARAGFERGWD